MKKYEGYVHAQNKMDGKTNFARQVLSTGTTKNLKKAIPKIVQLNEIIVACGHYNSRNGGYHGKGRDHPELDDS
uniref:Uncharacterized protein n=1 Tax=Romanomermis culicivorax TaxID=13658 RepID=A0A915HXS7_ROMCU